MSLCFSEELTNMVSTFEEDAKKDLQKFRGLVGPASCNYERVCRRMGLAIDPAQRDLHAEAYEKFFRSDVSGKVEVSICPTVTSEQKARARKHSDLSSLYLILHNVDSGEKMRLRLVSYCPPARECDLEYSRVD